MLRARTLLISCLALAGLCVLGPEARTEDAKKRAERFEELKKLLREADSLPAGHPERHSRLLHAFQRIAAEGGDEGLALLVDCARMERYAREEEDLLGLLAGRGENSTLVTGLFSDMLGKDHRRREHALTFLFRRAKARHEEAFPAKIFATGSIEDRFRAIEVLGQMGSATALSAAKQLLEDPTWKPIEDTKVGCATIIRALQSLQGSPAAEVLLLIQRDPRFVPGDYEAIQDATRVWDHKNLHEYIDLASLADPDENRRLEAIVFMGKASFEEARAPLLIIARDRRESPAVRAAAMESLGSLRIARGDLAVRLGRLLDDPDASVRRAALRGLARLRVRQAGILLAGLLPGHLGGDARAALTSVTGLPSDSDWDAWAAALPEGT